MSQIIKNIIPRDRFILALSGGIDSCSAAIYFKNQGYKFVATHHNAKLIAQDDIIECAVRDFCSQFNIELKVGYSDAKYTKGSKEEYCRNQRHKVFSKVVKETGINTIVAAHTLNDCVTSYLWNCIRGHLDFIPLNFVKDFEKYKVVRPFLLLSKKELSQLSPITLGIVEDELNSDNNLTRNFLKNQVIPLIHTKKHFNLNKTVKKIMINRLKNIKKIEF